MRRHNVSYDIDEDAFPAEAYSVRGSPGIAYRVYGWETEPDEDTHWSGFENRTGRVIAVMIGDDRPWIVDPEDLTPIARESYCGECGQMGCGHDGLDRSESEDATYTEDDQGNWHEVTA